jgi:peptide/nickel transport system permease protein
VVEPEGPVGMSAANRPAARRPLPPLLRALLRRPSALVIAAFLALIVLAVIAAPLIAPYDPNAQDLLNTYSGPTARHLLGTDNLGRDILSRLLYGGRVSLEGVAEAVFVLVALGLTAGAVAGYAGGWFERFVLWLADLTLALPSIIILLVVLTVFGRNETAAMITLGIVAAPGLMRVVRGVVLTVRKELHVSAAWVTGLPQGRILRRHILPHLSGPVIVQASIAAAGALLVETGIGYLGLGVQPPTPSWGNMIADASNAIYIQPWLLIPTGVTVGVVALSFGLLGDAVRDASAERTSRPRAIRRKSAAAPPQTLLPVPPSAAPASELLSVRNLSVAFPGPDGPLPVVLDASFEVRPGEVLGLVGESGCGKTVTALALMGLLPGGGRITSGQVLFGDRNLAALSQKAMRALRGSQIAYISQDPIASLDPLFTVGNQVAEVVRAHRRVSRAAARTRTLELLRLVNLDEPEMVAKRYPHELSGGMAQRVGIAMALAGEPKLLIADEPTTALDVTVQAEILDLLRALQQQTGMAVVLITHDWGVVADLCDRVVVMYAGQMVEATDVESAFHEPLHPYTLALLQSDPHGADAGERLPAIPGAVPPPGAWPVGCHFHARCAFATDECTRAPIPLAEPVAGHATRCLHFEQLRHRAPAAVSRPERAG